jgi:O-antigen/teichoic acid export membrane protein
MVAPAGGDAVTAAAPSQEISGTALAFAKSFAGNFAALGLGALATKVLAVLAGPSAMGLLSLLKQAQQLLSTVGVCNGQHVLMQGMAVRSGQARTRYLQSVGLLLLGSTLTVLAIWAAFADEIAEAVLGAAGGAYGLSLRAVVVPALLSAAAIPIAAAIAARRGTGWLATGPLIASIVMITLALPVGRAVAQGNVLAYVLLLSVSSLSTLLFYYWVATRFAWLQIDTTLPFDREAVRGFASGALAFTIAGGSSMIGLLVIRAVTIRHGGSAVAGVFDAAWTISSYFQVLLAALNTFFLPTLAQSSAANGIRLTDQTLRLSLAATVPILVLLICFADLLVQLLYSREFVPGAGLLGLLLAGNVLKTAAFVTASWLVAFPARIAFVVTEVASTMFLVAGAWLGLAGSGSLDGVAFGYWVGCGFVLVFCLVHSYRRYAVTLSGGTIARLLAAFVLLLSCVATQRMAGGIAISAALVAVALLYSWYTFTAAERRSVAGLLRRGPGLQ